MSGQKQPNMGDRVVKLEQAIDEFDGRLTCLLNTGVTPVQMDGNDLFKIVLDSICKSYLSQIAPHALKRVGSSEIEDMADIAIRLTNHLTEKLGGDVEGS